MTNNYKIFTLLACFCITAFALQGCHHDEPQDDKDTKFEVTDSLLKSLLIDTVEDASARTEITLTGSIAPDENKMVKVYPMVSGVAENIKVQLGDVVHKGQTLAMSDS